MQLRNLFLHPTCLVKKKILIWYVWCLWVPIYEQIKVYFLTGAWSNDVLLSSCIKICIRIKSQSEYGSNKNHGKPYFLQGWEFESLVLCEKMSEWAIRSKKPAIHSLAHLSWATWAIRSHCLGRSEQIAHIRSFDLSEMSEGANERRSNEWWANSQPWFFIT